jgi:uncharacterized protein VirK/YbjX
LLSNIHDEAGKLRGATLSRQWDRFRALSRDEGAWPLVINHARAVRLMTRNRTGDLARLCPGITTRYLAPYLCKSLSLRQRRDALLGQFALLDRALNDRFFLDLGDPGGVGLWTGGAAAGAYAIGLTLNTKLGGEGDLTLGFLSGEAALCELSFSITRLPTVSGDGAAAMFVARIQGASGCYDAIRQATRDCGDISPAHLLVAAADGLAAALSLDRIYGVSNDEQLSKSSDAKDGCLFDYDEFWSALSGERLGGWYRFDAPLGHKPLSQAPIEHRRRIKRKRRFKQQLRDRVAGAVALRYARRPARAADAERVAEFRTWLRLQTSAVTGS